MNLAYVLVEKPGLPAPQQILGAFGSYAAAGERLRTSGSETVSNREALEFELEPNGTAFVTAAPAPVPGGEADDAAGFSVAALGNGWRPRPHEAHLVVALTGAESLPAVARISLFTGATHSPEFFLETSREPGIVPRITLWTGVSASREPDGRMSLLSLGMRQLNLPDLLLVAPGSSGGEALETFFDLLAYVAELGKPLTVGDTIGRSAGERLPVRYVPSPIDSSRQVWRVDVR